MAIHSQLLVKYSFLRSFFYQRAHSRADYIIKLFQNKLNKKDKILDFGAGSCVISELLMEKGYQIYPVDIKNISLVPKIVPLIYNRKKLPLADNYFDLALIIGVLHHTPDPEKQIAEVQRVSKKLLIIEDVYNNFLEKYLTYFWDSLFNQEFRNHPRTNKKDQEWKKVFQDFGLRLIAVSYTRWNWCLFVKHATYYLEKNS